MFGPPKRFLCRAAAAALGIGACAMAASQTSQWREFMKSYPLLSLSEQSSFNKNEVNDSKLISMEKDLPSKKKAERRAFSLKAVYANILSDSYEERGELELGEEHLTVQDDIFAQIGVIEDDGMAHLFCTTEENETSTISIHPNDHVVDLGSGVGNVCMWVFAHTDARKVTGVEFIPSRHSAGVQAKKAAEMLYPNLFQEQSPESHASRRLSFVNGNIAEKVSDGDAYKLNSVYSDATVYFTHSWVFDEELLNKIGDIVLHHSPKARVLLTSRRIPVIDAEIDGAKQSGTSPKLKYKGIMHCNADWNEEAPFHIYASGAD